MMTRTQRIWSYSALFIGVIFVVSLGVMIRTVYGDREVSVVFLDVGQGDSILISQGFRQILIDGGRSGARLREHLGRRIPFWDKSLDVVLVTHPDADHFAGLVDGADRYRIGAVVETGAVSSSHVFEEWQKKIAEEHIPTVEGKSGARIRLAGGNDISVVYPSVSIGEDTSLKSNDTSIVARLETSGGEKFLFTGDLPSTREGEIAPEAVRADILKVGHHGSKYSTSDEFLAAVSPRYAIVSVGKNSYGHPAPEVMNRLTARGAKIFRTDTDGTIVYRCKEGERCEVRKEI